MSTKTVVSLFTGAGGLDLGFVKTGFEIVFANELEDFACETYKYNFSKYHDTSYLKCGDLENYWNDIPKNQTLLIGGPPCQSFSMAGNRKGLDHSNGNLFISTVQHLPLINPRLFILENVQGLLTFPDGDNNPLQIILSEITKAGYECIYKLFDLSEYGVNQRRKRVIFFGKKIGDPINLAGLVPRISSTSALNVDHLLKAIPAGLEGDEFSKPNNVQRIFGQIIAPGENLNSILRLGEDEIKNRLLRKGLLDDPKLPLENGKPRIPKRGQDIQRLDPYKVAPTMCFNKGTTVHWHPWINRSLTVREAATIQSFPFDFEFKGKKLEDKYLQIANAVPPVFSEVLAKQLLTILNEEK